MTAHAMKGDRERCLAAGMDDYVSKPVQREELLRVLNWAASRASTAIELKAEVKEQETATISEQTPPPTGLPPALDRVAAVERLGGDAELFGEVAAVFLGDVPKMLEEIRRGIAANDAAWVKRAAHGLKGAAGYVGGKPAAEAAAVLEAPGTRVESWPTHLVRLKF